MSFSVTRASVLLLHCDSRGGARMSRASTHARAAARAAPLLFHLAKRAKLRSKLLRRLSMQRDMRERATKIVVVLQGELKQLKRF
jgi:hypothetical protein